MKYSIPQQDLKGIDTKKTKFKISDSLLENTYAYVSQLARPFIIGEIILHFNISISVAEEVLSLLEKDKKIIQLSEYDKRLLGYDIRNNIFVIRK